MTHKRKVVAFDKITLQTIPSRTRQNVNSRICSTTATCRSPKVERNSVTSISESTTIRYKDVPNDIESHERLQISAQTATTSISKSSICANIVSALHGKPYSICRRQRKCREAVMFKRYIIGGCFIQVHIIPSKDSCNANIKFRICKTVTQCQDSIPLDRQCTYLIPIHCLVPLPKLTTHLVMALLTLPSSRSQRSGLKTKGSGNKELSTMVK